MKYLFSTEFIKAHHTENSEFFMNFIILKIKAKNKC